MDVFSIIKARDTIQTVLEGRMLQRIEIITQTIDLKFNDARKSHGALENEFFSPKGHPGFKISVMQLSNPNF